MRTLTIGDLKITLITERSTISAYESLSECMSKEEIKKLLNKSYKNQWAWCDVELRAEFQGLETSEYLGGCSYKNEADFVSNSGYYDDMARTALDYMQAQINAIVARLS